MSNHLAVQVGSPSNIFLHSREAKRYTSLFDFVIYFFMSLDRTWSIYVSRITGDCQGILSNHQMVRHYSHIFAYCLLFVFSVQDDVSDYIPFPKNASFQVNSFRMWLWKEKIWSCIRRVVSSLNPVKQESLLLSRW